MIGIITIHDNNLGNRLQNYAVFKLLSKFDDVQNIIFVNDKKLSFRRIKNQLFDSLKYKKRIKNYSKFDKDYLIHFRNKFYRDSKLTKLDASFDQFVIGSDQVWNPVFCLNALQYYMAGFSSKNKIALSPSFGVDHLSDDLVEIYTNYLNRIQYLSCREFEGSNLITSLTGQKVPTLLDPTLMLNPDDWDAISHKPENVGEDDNYILCYFLGQRDSARDEYVKRTANESGLKIIDLMDKSGDYYSCGPSEFIWLVKHSSIILTDSFHCTVFSFLYDKPLKIIHRIGGESMNSRLNSLARLIGLNESVFLKDWNDRPLLKTEYDKTKLNAKRIEFEKYLSEAVISGVSICK